MPHTITAPPDKPYVVLTVSGTVDRVSALQHNREAHALGRQLGIDRYLVDMVDCRNVDSVLENYEFAYCDMNLEGINRNARVAVLVAPEDHSHDFVEIVSRNAGLDVTLFRDRESAERHLAFPGAA